VQIFSSFSATDLQELPTIETRIFICALSIGSADFKSGIASRDCCLELLFGFTEKWISFNAFSMIDVGYGLLVSGFTQRPETEQKKFAKHYTYLAVPL